MHPQAPSIQSTPFLLVYLFGQVNIPCAPKPNKNAVHGVETNPLGRAPTEGVTASCEGWDAPATLPAQQTTDRAPLCIPPPSQPLEPAAHLLPATSSGHSSHTLFCTRTRRHAPGKQTAAHLRSKQPELAHGHALLSAAAALSPLSSYQRPPLIREREAVCS